MGWGELAGVVGGIAPSIITAFTAGDTNRANTALTHQQWNVASNEARIQREWEEKMSNSAYQRATDDMKKAGINPMVAFQQGGASTPSGATGQVASPNKLDNVMQGFSASAMDALRLGNEMKLQGNQMKMNDALATKALAEATTSGASAKQMEANTKAVTSQLEAIAKEAKVRSEKAGYDSSAVKYDAIMSRMNRDSTSARNLMDMFSRGMKRMNPKEVHVDSTTGEILNP